MNPDLLYKERTERIMKAINLEKPDRVPILGLVDTWAATNAGYTIDEMIRDYQKVDSAFAKVIQDYEWDCMKSVFVRSPGLYQALGTVAFNQSEGSGAMQHQEAEYMLPEEYTEFLEDPFAFIVNKVLPRQHSELAKSSPGSSLALSKGAFHYNELFAAIGSSHEKWQKRYGMPKFSGASFNMPMDFLMSYLRGLRGLSLDVRRRPEEVAEACEKILPLMLRYVDACYAGQPNDFPVVMTWLYLPAMLRPKVFEKLYWPTFKKTVEALVAKGYTVAMQCQGKVDGYIDYLQDIASNRVVAIIEDGDMKTIKEKIGSKMCIAGNFPLQLLQYGTENECIRHAAKLIDDCASGGGYIFTTDKTMISGNDGKPENVAAVNKFVMEYGVYR